MTTNTIHVVVLGGGYAGVMAALRVAGKTRRLSTAVTLVNGLDYFMERPRLHEQATGTPLKGQPLTHMLRGRGITFVPGWVKAIRPEAKEVVVDTAAGEGRLPYHYLVLALGSRVNRQAVPGVADYAYTLDPYGCLTTDALQARLAAWGTRPFQAVVVGGGATGVEMAGQLKGQYPQATVSLVTAGAAGAFKGGRIQAHIRQALQEQAITIREGCRVQAVDQKGVQLAGGHLAAEVVIWAGGFVASPLGREAGLEVNERDQVLVDSYLRTLSHAHIYAVGDMAAPVEEPGAPMRMALFPALVSGAQAADNIVAEIKGKRLRPLSFAWYGQAIALGPHDAVGFATYPADAAVGPIYRRLTAVRLRRFFVWFLQAVLELERRFPGFLFWNGRGRFAKQQQHKPQPEASYF